MKQERIIRIEPLVLSRPQARSGASNSSQKVRSNGPLSSENQISKVTKARHGVEDHEKKGKTQGDHFSND